MKRLAIFISCIAVALASCESGAMYKDRLDDIKHTYCLPADAVVIKEIGVQRQPAGSTGRVSEDHMWCVFVLGCDTILYHCYTSGEKSRESMCRASAGIIGETYAEPEESDTRETAEESSY
jgi:hypothetical protein